MEPKEIETDGQMLQWMNEEWLRVLVRMWDAVGRPVEAQRLDAYKRALGMVPIGLLELAVAQALRENGSYQTIPTPGAVWSAVLDDLGHPHDIQLAIERWQEECWSRYVHPFGMHIETVPEKQ